MEDYCIKECEKGKAASKKFLDENNSAFDAVIDFKFWVRKCKETCNRFKEDKHEGE